MSKDNLVGLKKSKASLQAYFQGQQKKVSQEGTVHVNVNGLEIPLTDTLLTEEGVSDLTSITQLCALNLVTVFVPYSDGRPGGHCKIFQHGKISFDEFVDMMVGSDNAHAWTDSTERMNQRCDMEGPEGVEMLNKTIRSGKQSWF